MDQFDSLLFARHDSTYRDDESIIKLTAADGAKISARFLHNSAARYTILHSHGNAEDLGNIEGLLRLISQLGFSVLAYDYHGYGTSQGQPTESACYSDIDAAYSYLTQEMKLPPQHVIVYGRSMGSGPSIDLATRQPVAGLVIESGFTSASRVLLPISLHDDRFCNLEKIPLVVCPVLIMHSRTDSIIPFRHGQQLYGAVRSPKSCLWLDDAAHETFPLDAGEKYRSAMQEFAFSLESVKQP